MCMYICIKIRVNNIIRIYVCIRGTVILYGASDFWLISARTQSNDMALINSRYIITRYMSGAYRGGVSEVSGNPL